MSYLKLFIKESRERIINETTQIRGTTRGPRPRNCSIWEHATCVSRVIQNFNYTECLNAETPCIGMNFMTFPDQYGSARLLNFL